MVLGVIIPHLFLHELRKLLLNFKHHMHLLLLKHKISRELLRVVREVKTILEIYIVQPLLQVILEEPKR